MKPEAKITIAPATSEQEYRSTTIIEVAPHIGQREDGTTYDIPSTLVVISGAAEQATSVLQAYLGIDSDSISYDDVYPYINKQCGMHNQETALFLILQNSDPIDAILAMSEIAPYMTSGLWAFIQMEYQY